MSATESWRERQARVKRDQAELSAVVLRLEASAAQGMGIDVFEPGWRDEYVRMQDERDREIDSLIATPHVGEAIEVLEQQFEPQEADDAS